ncbi:hypothetical protein NL676_016866 [Syzygium grande]|nr:hypothetical protein NL676_016866 [Syzygium grande]
MRSLPTSRITEGRPFFPANENERGPKKPRTRLQTREERNETRETEEPSVELAGAEPLPLGSLAEPQRDDEPGDMQSSRKGSTRRGGSELTRRGGTQPKLTAETKREPGLPQMTAPQKGPARATSHRRLHDDDSSE